LCKIAIYKAHGKKCIFNPFPTFVGTKVAKTLGGSFDSPPTPEGELTASQERLPWGTANDQKERRHLLNASANHNYSFFIIHYF
jgi:hypothetical protein